MTGVTLKVRDKAGNLSTDAQVVINWQSSQRPTFGMNLPSGYAGTNVAHYDPAGETVAQTAARYARDYAITDGKSFEALKLWPAMAVSKYAGLKKVCIETGYPNGSIADGSHDVPLLAHLASSPPTILKRYYPVNEPDNNKLTTQAQYDLMCADAEHMQHLIDDNGYGAHAESWVCMMASSVSTWKTRLDPTCFKGVIVDCYQHSATNDPDMIQKLGPVSKVIDDWGSRWGHGEYGVQSQRYNDPLGGPATDLARSVLLLRQWPAILAFGAEFINWFDMTGPQGDWRVLTSPLGNDAKTYAALKTCMAG